MSGTLAAMNKSRVFNQTGLMGYWDNPGARKR